MFAYWSTRMAKRDTGDDFGDAGLAIVEFGRAFPAEAIRTLRTTADRKVVFVRLHDNKAGIMRNMGNHYACRVIEPGSVRVQPTSNRNGFAIEFRDAPAFNDEFVFSSAEEAAEVSLWMLGNYTTAADIKPVEKSAG